MKKEKLYLAIAFSTIAIFYIYFFSSLPIDYSNTPDESQIKFFTENFKKTGELYWKSNLNTLFQTEFFRPRGSVLIQNNHYSSLVSPHIILVYSILSSILTYKGAIIAISLIGILFFYLLSKEIFEDSKKALASTIILSILPPYFFYTLTLTDLIPSLLFLTISFYCLAKFYKSNKIPLLFLSAIFFLLSTLIRIHNAIFFVLFIPLLWQKKKVLLSLNWRKKTIFTLLLFSASAILLLLNYLAYESFFSTGRILTGETIEEKTLLSKIFLYGISTPDIFLTFQNYLLEYLPIFFCLTIIGSVYLFRKTKSLRAILVLFGLISIFFTIYFGSNNTFFNFEISSVHSSLSRYFLPLYIFSIPIFTNFLFKIKNKKISFLIIFLLVISFINFSLVNEDSFSRLINNKELSKEINQWASSLPEDSIFIVKQSDKLVVPNGNILLSYQSSDLAEHPFLTDHYSLIDNTKFLGLIEKTNNLRYPIYISKENSNLIKILKQNGYTLTKENSIFYKVEK